MLTCTVSSQAQQVYNELRMKARNTVDDQKANMMVRKISQFKLDALNYLAIKMREEIQHVCRS